MNPRENEPNETVEGTVLSVFFEVLRSTVKGLRTFALIVCAQRNCAGNATVICHALLRALVKLRFENLCRNRER